MTKVARCVLALGVCLAGLQAASTAHAHASSTDYLEVDARQADRMSGRWDLPVAALDWQLDLDADGDRRITWLEIDAASAAIGTLALANLRLARGGRDCELSVASPLALTEHLDEPHVALDWRASWAADGPLKIASGLTFGDATHRSLLTLVDARETTAAVLVPGDPAWQQAADGTPWWRSFAAFVAQGAFHVWIGYDHLAFLLLLILPSVLVVERGHWRAAGSAKWVVRDLALIVTAFTISHSITLALAATQTVSLPAGPIEAAIALSIVIAGVLNLRPGWSRWRLPLAFGFGFVHGFGFANALLELNVTGRSLVPVLAGFNIGVELAQLALVLVSTPLLLLLARQPIYARRLMPAMSIVTAVVGAGWLLQRLA